MDKDDVEINDETGEAVGTQISARMKMMEALADKAEENREGDLEDVPSEELAERPYKLGVDDNGDVLGKGPGEDEDDDEDDQESRSTPTKFKIKVNGKEVELTHQELIERAQKVASADEYLAEAARRRQAAETQQPSKEDADAKRDRFKALARALQMGSEEEAADVIEQLMQGPSLKADDLVRVVDERMTFQDAASRFTKEYSDLWEDQRLQAMIRDEDQRLVNAGDSRAPFDRFKAIGDGLRQWRDGLRKPASGFEEKRQRKASVTAIPTASGKQAMAVSEEREESTSETIANMAKARGQLQ